METQQKPDRPQCCWTVKDILVGQGLLVILLTTVLSVVLIILADNVLTSLLWRGGDRPTVSGYFIGSLCLSLFVLSAMLTVFILKAFFNYLMASMETVKAARLYSWGHRFRWSIYYSVIIAHIALQVLLELVGCLDIYQQWDNPQKSSFLLLVVIVVVNRTVKFLHRQLMVRSAPNMEMGADIILGEYRDRIPPKYDNIPDNMGLAFAVFDGRAFNAESAAVIYWILGNGGFRSTKRNMPINIPGAVAFVLSIGIIDHGRKGMAFYGRYIPTEQITLWKEQTYGTNTR